MEPIYDYLFHYNSFERLWWAIPRDEYLNYWNSKKEKCMSASNIDELITKINGE